MNYSLLDPPNVAGYEGGMSWVDGGLFNTRKEVLSRLLLDDDFDFDFENKRQLFLGFRPMNGNGWQNIVGNCIELRHVRILNNLLSRRGLRFSLRRYEEETAPK